MEKELAKIIVNHSLKIKENEKTIEELGYKITGIKEVH